MQAGDMAYVEYNGFPGVVHARLLLALVDADDWAIWTPDRDLYVEQMSPNNVNFSLFFHIPDGSLPPGIPAGQIYSFGAITANEYAQAMTDGRAERDAERARRGLLGPPAALIPPVAVAGGGASGHDSFWVLAEMVNGHKIGERVNPPGNMPCLNDFGLMVMNDSDGTQRTVLVHKLTSDRLASFCEERIGFARSSESLEGEDQVAAEDVRTMAIQYNANGERMRSFRESVGEFVQVSFEDFPLEPRTCLEYLRAVVSVSESCYGQHLAWIQQAKIPDSNRAIHEDEVLARILDTCITYDCLNPTNLACMELVVRRRQLIAQAHAVNPSAPSYDGADLFLGNQYRSGGIVVPTLKDHVSKGLQAESQILKERRKLAEARAYGGGKGGGPNQPPKGDGAGRGGGAPKS